MSDMWESESIEKTHYLEPPVVIQKKIKCKRCGVCCLNGVCDVGFEDEDGVCKYLYFIGNLAHCRLLVEKKVKPEDIGLNGSGCVIRRIPSIFQEFKENAENLLYSSDRFSNAWILGSLVKPARLKRLSDFEGVRDV